MLNRFRLFQCLVDYCILIWHSVPLLSYILEWNRNDSCIRMNHTSLLYWDDQLYSVFLIRFQSLFHYQFFSYLLFSWHISSDSLYLWLSRLSQKTLLPNTCIRLHKYLDYSVLLHFVFLTIRINTQIIQTECLLNLTHPILITLLLKWQMVQSGLNLITWC